MSQIYDEVDPAYAATCSDVTLCLNSKGFFKNLVEELMPLAEEDNWIQTFERIEIGERVKAVMENKEIMGPLTEVLSRIQPMFRGKDARVSNERRLAAQAAFKEGNLEKALAFASQAVLRAPMTGHDEVVDGGVSLALALWQRSEVLLRAGRPFAALGDLKMALKERLPAKMRAQYYWRLGHCYKGAGEPTRAKVSYELAGRLFGNDETAQIQLTKDVESLDYSERPKNPPNKTDSKSIMKQFSSSLSSSDDDDIGVSQHHKLTKHKILTVNTHSQSVLVGALGNGLSAFAENATSRSKIDGLVRSKIDGATPTGGTEQNMPALSKLIKIAEEENKGRFAVANSQIMTGDVILVDNPYAACLLSDLFGTHCLHCFKRLDDCENEAPVWCPKCSGVAFCSIQCRDTAVSTYHSMECQFLDLFIGSGMSILSHIALRMITQAGLDTSLSIYSKYLSNKVKTVDGTVLNDIGVFKKTKMRNRKERLIRAKKGLKNFNDNNVREDEGDDKVDDKEGEKVKFEETLELKAAQIYSLCTHTNHRKGKDYFKRVLMAIFLTECLKKGGFFKSCAQERSAKAESSVCELIVCHLQLLQFNAHEIYETVRGEHQFSGSKTVYIAVGIYPTGALFNHECYPSVARYFEGRKIVLRAIRPLQPGDVVSENYGPNFLVRNLKERQRSLACRYWFRCECVACKEDWPILKQMTSDSPPYLRCPNISCTGKFRANLMNLPNRCPKCSSNIDKGLMKVNLETVSRCVAQYQKGAKLMEEQLPLEAITEMCEAIDLYHEVARPPHRDTHLAQESLRTCFAAAGNVHVVRNNKEDN